MYRTQTNAHRYFVSGLCKYVDLQHVSTGRGHPHEVQNTKDKYSEVYKLDGLTDTSAKF